MGLMDKFSAEVNRAGEEFKELIGKAPQGSSGNTQGVQVSHTIYVGNNVRYVSPENCQNCGAHLVNNNLKFCPECGTELELIRICAKCGTRVQEDDEFCPECGAGLSLARACAKCGTRVQEDDDFCPECGTPLKGKRVNINMSPGDKGISSRGFSKIILGILVVCVIGMGIFFAKEVIFSEKPMEVKAETLVTDYMNNSTAADKKYKGKLLRVTGEVVAKEQFTDVQDYYVMIYSKWNFGKRYALLVGVEPKKINILNSLKIHDFVAAEGVCSGIIPQKNPDNITIHIEATKINQ